jgi:hypothetical protein
VALPRFAALLVTGLREVCSPVVELAINHTAARVAAGVYNSRSCSSWRDERWSRHIALNRQICAAHRKFVGKTGDENRDMNAKRYSNRLGSWRGPLEPLFGDDYRSGPRTSMRVCWYG